MPQALPAPSAALSPVIVCTGPQPAETANSGQSFSDALSNELGAGDAATTPAAQEPAPAEPMAAAPDRAADATAVAAGGNSLPYALPPEAMLALSMLMPGTAPNPAVSNQPAAAAGREATWKTDSTAQVSVNATPVVAPTAAISTAAFAMPAATQTDSPGAGDAAATVAASATVAKPALSMPYTLVTTNAATTPAITLPTGSDVDPSAASTKASAASLSAVTDSLKAVVAPVRAEPVIDVPAVAAPTHVSVESMAALASTPAATGTGSTAPSATVSVPLGQPAWGQAFGNQVVWAVNQGLPAAALHLSPPELGPVSVHIRLDQDQASIAFSSPHVAVRDAIEAAIPRLRDMLGTQGIALVDVNVSQHHSAHTGRDWGAQDNTGAFGQTRDGDAVAAAPMARAVAAGVLDLYV